MNLKPKIRARIPSLYQKLIRSVVREAGERGLHPYLVGGVVRDLLLGAPFAKDCDIVLTGGSISKLAHSLTQRWKADLSSHPQFLTFTLKSGAIHLDLITARSEVYPRPADLPFVTPANLESDLRRRDFTINAMAADLGNGASATLVDPLGGWEDLKARKIRILHPKSFEDDPTRIFRMARYAARFRFEIEADTRVCLNEALRGRMIERLTRDRIRIEIEKIMHEKDPAPSLRLLSEWGVIGQIDPVLSLPDVSSKALAKSERSVAVRMGLWLIGDSAVEAQRILEDLHFPGAVREKALQIVEFYAHYKDSRTVTDLARGAAFDETIQALKALSAAQPDPRFRNWFQALCKWLDSAPVLTGQDLKKMGIAPGPAYKDILHRLALARFEGSVKTRGQEMALVRALFDNSRRQ